ncbi:hypothetical protein FB567DRAFT_532650 [Paraphoma chrysanthemicola]|uniref:Uncharacterized protein n=1 Tax=Paraphoma chrysanthemicola TaxID=798071 RepID=A0A8K0R1E0_9PLEO|nr:hypothetical protein FB567DRAFT_532650 [Paraphoma chrysanthemicola]
MTLHSGELTRVFCTAMCLYTASSTTPLIRYLYQTFYATFCPHPAASNVTSLEQPIMSLFGPINPIPDDVPYPYNKAWCRNFYWRVLDGKTENASTATWCTIAIIFCAILLEIVVHISFGSLIPASKTKSDEEAPSLLPDNTPDLVSQQPQPESEPHAEPPSAEGQQIDAKPASTEASSMSCCPASPSPRTRATRLVFALILYSITLGTFITRIHSASTPPHIDYRCRAYISVPAPNWTAITFLNIIPFICASFAFLRTLVDCVLVRWRSGLRNDFQHDGCFWFPCMPFFGLALIVYLTFEALKIPVAWIMGDWDVSLWTQWSQSVKNTENIEMGGEEARGLMDNVDVVGEDEDTDVTEGLPAYDEVVGTERERGNSNIHPSLQENPLHRKISEVPGLRASTTLSTRRNIL